ncbi:MAG: HEAT repeat domain-containing protein [Planctomycetes bacterium]|nr:HEAT repeat domain-containing protein [Planctomycetota bacterium]
MNDTLKVIVGVLEAGRPELQVAAVQILGELRAKEPAVVRAVTGAVGRSPVLGRFALDALAKIGTKEAWETIAKGLVEHEVLAEHASQLLAEAGAIAHPVLAALYADAAGEHRLRILGVLGKGLGRDGGKQALGKESIGVFVQALLTPELTDVAARLLQDAAAHFDAANQKVLREGLGKHLEGPLPDLCLANAASVLAKVDAAASRPILVRLTAPTVAPLVRSAAFRALRGSKLTAAQVSSMMELLEDATQRDVHDAVREVLAELPELPEGLVPVLKRLLASRQAEQRLFALRMLRTAGGPDLAKISLKLLDHADERFRDAAAEALAYNKHAIEPLIRLLQTTREAGIADKAAAILTRLGPHFSPKVLRGCADKAVKMLGGRTRIGDLLFDVVLAVGDAKVVPVFLERAVRLRRAKHHAEALHILAKLAASPRCDNEVRYQLALTKMVADMVHVPPGLLAPGAAAADASAPVQVGNATMGFFTALVRSGFPLADRLRKESVLSPEALLRIATHFADAVGLERRFGTDLLQHLATRTKGRAGEEARVALRTAGV